MSVLNNRNYFSRANQIKYMGVSQFKTFESCQAMALAELRGRYVREKTVSLYVGSYVDAYFEGTLEKFKEENPEIFKKDGTLKSEYIKADEIIYEIERQPLMSKLLSGERQKIMTGTIAGVEVKIKIDSFLPDTIVDLKIMKDFEPIYKEEQGRLPWWQAWRYDLQGGVYQEIVRQNTGVKLPFVLVAATKERVTDVDVLEIPQAFLDFELEQFVKNAPYYDAIKNKIIPPIRCEKCEYCKRTKILKEIRKIEDVI